ncbi:MAG: phytanoyl-CoA dioxygenase family protein, partial [Alphaproteobacteria bacterium]
MPALAPELIERFRAQGWLVAPGGVTAPALARLGAELAQWVEASRAHDASYGETMDGVARFDLEAGHTRDRPRLRRVNNPAEISEAWREASFAGATADMVADLIGPDVKFIHSKINLKLPATDTRVGFHQDFAYVPLTNEDMVTALLML